MGYKICANRYYCEDQADFYNTLYEHLSDTTNLGTRLKQMPYTYPCEVYIIETSNRVTITANYDKQTWARSNIFNDILGFFINYREFDIQFITSDGSLKHGSIVSKSSNYVALLKFKMHTLFKKPHVNEHTLALLAPCFEDINSDLLQTYRNAEILITKELILGESLC